MRLSNASQKTKHFGSGEWPKLYLFFFPQRLNQKLTWQAGILVLITLVRSQSYDPDYHISEDGDHSGYSGGEEQQEHQHPDYSKYFSSDVSAPLQGKADAGGFVAPIEFNSFLGTPTFGMYNKIKICFFLQTFNLIFFGSFLSLATALILIKYCH